MVSGVAFRLGPHLELLVVRTELAVFACRLVGKGARCCSVKLPTRRAAVVLTATPYCWLAKSFHIASDSSASSYQQLTNVEAREAPPRPLPARLSLSAANRTGVEYIAGQE